MDRQVRPVSVDIESHVLETERISAALPNDFLVETFVRRPALLKWELHVAYATLMHCAC